MYNWSSEAQRCETLNADIAATTATFLTSDASSAHTKGAWVDLGSPTFPYEGIIVIIADSFNLRFLIDIAISDGTNRWVIVENIYTNNENGSGDQGIMLHFPIHIPSGVTVSARCSSSTANSQVNIEIIGLSHNTGGAPGYARAVSLGAFTASTRGTTVDPGATANTKGAWTEFASSLSADVVGFLGLIGPAGDIARAAAADALMDIGVGAAGSESVIFPDYGLCWGSSYDNGWMRTLPLFLARIPSGSRVAARAQCSINTAGDRTLDLMLYGLVP